MSKAFTKEEGGAEEPLMPMRPRAASGEKRYITPEGYQALEEELAALRGPDEGAAGTELEVEGRKRERERRAQQLAAVLEDVQVVEPDASQEGHVFFGAWVTLEDEDGAEAVYRLVGPDEADVKAGRLSVEAPLARALLGKEVGESVVVERPRGAVEYTVTGVRYTTH